jgi:1-acyl-sn-glycerol-3-phosphate acyltransferase
MPRTRALTPRWRLVAGLVIAILRAARWRIEVEGLEHVPRDGGAVLAFNHHSYVDFVMVAWGPVRLLGRPVRFLAKREVWEHPVIGRAARWLGAVPVDRGRAAARTAALDEAVAALAAGELVVVAPEQTISRSFELLPLRTGAARMAQRAGVPIVPVAGWGTQRVATKGQPVRLRTRLPVLVRFTPPLWVGVDDDPLDATEELRRRLERAVHAAQEAYPDGAPVGASWVPARLGGAAPTHHQVLDDHRQRLERWETDGGAGP